MALFVDIVTITVKAGDGGNGCVSFHREKFVQAGGPDGGDGGRGGDVIFEATERMHTLMDFRYTRKFTAGNGEDGSANRKTGKSGENAVILVPPGTIVREKATGRLLLDLYEAGVQKTLARGGKGGFGNQHFATPTRQAPQFAKPGEKRPIIELTLELKSIADVGLVGFPNVGKSTILSVVTAARPKIANYHFTTLTPNLGIVKQGPYSFVMADIPGLVEGAAEGVGPRTRVSAPCRAHAAAFARNRRFRQRRPRPDRGLRGNHEGAGGIRRSQKPPDDRGGEQDGSARRGGKSRAPARASEGYRR